MSLLGKLLLFILMGCAYTQQFGQLGNDVDKQLNDLNKRFESGLKDMNSQGFDFSNFNQRQNNFGGSNFGSNNFDGSPFGGNFGNSRDNADIKAYLSQLSLIQQQIPLIVAAKCQQAGHSEVTQNLEKLMMDAQTCFKQKVDLNSDVSAEFSGAARTNELPNFFKKYCKVWPEIHGCINPLVSSLEKCLESDEKRTVDKTLELIDETNNYFCKNSANNLIKLVDSASLECFETVKDDVQKCATSTVEKRQKQLQKNSSEKKAIFAYDQETCGEFHSGRKCITSKLATCKTQDPSKVIDDYLQLVQEKVCSSATRYSLFSFVNVLLLVGTYLYTKMF